MHITNSEIEGARASFDAGPGAKVFLQGATLKGATRRDERAEVQEQGGKPLAVKGRLLPPARKAELPPGLEDDDRNRV